MGSYVIGTQGAQVCRDKSEMFCASTMLFILHWAFYTVQYYASIKEIVL